MNLSYQFISISFDSFDILFKSVFGGLRVFDFQLQNIKK